MSWFLLLLAILMEVAGTTCMKLSESFTRPMPSLGVFGFYAVSLTLLTGALRTIDVSVAYAIWAGVGTALIAFLGMVWFKEPATTMKMLSLMLIIAGVVGLNLTGGH